MCVRGRTYNTKSYGFDDNIRITPFTQKDASAAAKHAMKKVIAMIVH